MTWQRSFALMAVFLFLCLPLSGCGDSNVFDSLADDNSPEAQLDLGLAAIDNGDYESAIATLEALNLAYPNDPEIERYLASAYAGRAGFDALTLINILSQDDEGGNDAEMFRTIGDLFGADESGNIPELASKIADVGSALDLLAPDGLTDDESRFQAGLYGATQSVLLTVDILDGASIDRIETMTNDEIATRVGNNFGAPLSDTDPTAKGVALVESLALVADAAIDLANSVDPASGDSNDIAVEMDIMLGDIGYADDNDVDQNELTLYLQSL